MKNDMMPCVLFFETFAVQASVVFINCTFDLAGPGSFDTDPLLDRIRQVLSQLLGVDVKINMADLFMSHIYKLL